RVVAARFQALPFLEPSTNLIYVRARWYDVISGTFLSSDPKGYIDSSTLYSLAGGDPVNKRDPKGEDAVADKVRSYVDWHRAQMTALSQERRRLEAAYKDAFARRDPEMHQYLLDQDYAILAETHFGGFPHSVETYLRYQVDLRGNNKALGMSFEDLHA